MKLKSKKQPSDSRYQVEALARGLSILELFTSEAPALSLSEVVAALEINKSTAYRFLTTLETMGYLERDSSNRRYRPSLKVLQLGFRAINLDVRQVARPYLERLAQDMCETVSMGVMSGTDVIYIDRVRNRSIVGVVLEVGSRLPAHTVTIGKVLLSEYPPEKLAGFLEKAKLKEFGPKTITTHEGLLAELSLAREQGFAICDEELAPGLMAAGALIRDHHGKAIAGINVSGSVSTISIERLKNEIAPAVVETARQISQAIGYVPE
ncbi:MAG: IclR family transcriptional regulator [Desulfobacula sp.]|jgi:IclR family pca regulon transcriptional regulator